MTEEYPNGNKEFSHRAAHFIVSSFMGSVLIAIAIWIGHGTISFMLIAVVLMYLGRRIGWILSRNSLYMHPLIFITVECVIWGVLTAYLIRYMISWQEPKWWARWVMGYALGAYISVPNYGLLIESSIPEDAQTRHFIISKIPLIAYIGSTVWFAHNK